MAGAEFLFLAGFMQSIKSNRIFQCTIEGDSGFGRQLADALFTLHRFPSQKGTIADVLQETFVWQHDEIQRELDKLVVKAHDDLYDLNPISDQQDKANLLSIDTSVFQLVPRTKILRIKNEALVYLAKQLFEKILPQVLSEFCTKHW